MDLNITGSISNYSEYDGIDDHAQHMRDIGYYLIVIGAPVLILLGTVGNILSMVVLIRLCRKGVWINVYLAVLAMSDITLLWSSTFRQWLALVGKDIILDNLVFCNFGLFLAYFSGQFSSWIQVVVTLSRLMAVWSPFHIQNRCTPKVSVIVIACVFSTLAGLNLQFSVYQLDIVHTDVSVICVASGHRKFFVGRIWPWMGTTLYSFVPCVILIIGTVCIRVKVMESAKRAPRNTAARNGRTNKNSYVTAVLITINVVFIVCTTPAGLLFIYLQIVPETSKVVKEVIYAVSKLLMWTDHVINFVLYCIAGSRFREEFKRLIRRQEHTNRHVVYITQHALSDISTVDIRHS
jgi:hypothetical protein